MANQNWVNLLNSGSPWQTNSGTAISASATTATISYQPASNTDFPISGFQVGTVIRTTARGTVNTGGTQSVLTVFLATQANNTGGTYVTLATSTGLQLGTGSLTGLQWKCECISRVIAVASSGNTINTQGEFEIVATPPGNPLLLSANKIVMPMPNISGENAAAVNTLIVQGWALRATMSAAFGLIQLSQFQIEQMD